MQLSCSLAAAVPPPCWYHFQELCLPSLRGIAGIKLLPNGVPADRTIFLPNNDAVAALLTEVPIPVSGCNAHETSAPKS